MFLLLLGLLIESIVFSLQMHHSALECLGVLIDLSSLSASILEPVTYSNELLVDDDVVDGGEHYFVIIVHLVNKMLWLQNITDCGAYLDGRVPG